jgi:excisionase family DNA binding protein
LLSDFDNHDPDFDVMALVPEHLRANWDETVKHMFEEWDKWTPCDPPPELLDYRRIAEELDAPHAAPVATGERLLVDIPEAARMLSCGRTLIYELIRTQQLRIVKIGRLTRIPAAALRDLVERRLTEAMADAAVEEPEWWERLSLGDER